MRQVTLISLYGEKPLELVNLITHCQEMIAEIPGIEFTPYNLQQIHATILGLEQVAGTQMHNLNLAKYRNQSQKMDVYRFLDCLRTSDKIPFQIQIGGFKHCDYPFTSRGQRPYQRSFSVQGDKAVLMGWPVCNHTLDVSNTTYLDLPRETYLYPSTLDQLRKAAQAFNILHAYHRTPTDVDNDFYFRIGLLNPETLNDSSKKSLENSFREFLSKTTPIIVQITLFNLYVASYEDEKLPLNSTKVWSLQDSRLTQELIYSLYSVRS